MMDIYRLPSIFFLCVGSRGDRAIFSTVDKHCEADSLKVDLDYDLDFSLPSFLNYKDDPDTNHPERVQRGFENVLYSFRPNLSVFSKYEDNEKSKSKSRSTFKESASDL